MTVEEKLPIGHNDIGDIGLWWQTLETLLILPDLHIQLRHFWRVHCSLKL